ncbi:MAG: hypothetical protein C0436_04955 [Alphaproteobacteria bacterium]|nr:hypothetical protein [Alphaproteobacteria bacterium]
MILQWRRQHLPLQKPRQLPLLLLPLLPLLVLVLALQQAPARGQLEQGLQQELLPQKSVQDLLELQLAQRVRVQSLLH